MTRRWRIRYAGAKYHLTARGNGRDDVFLERDDYERFLEQLKVAHYFEYKSETVIGRQRATLRRRLVEDPPMKKRFETAKRKVSERLNASY